ncbi:MAG: hypothetical protein EA376_14225 [Phycisphaeraceae bacterium]|nr:MAG: hypothetical protein EA376_14225 [Phycisphaeraceae bacterium]
MRTRSIIHAYTLLIPLALLALALHSAPAPAQEGTNGAEGQRVDALPPAVRLGVRVEITRRRLPISPTLVIVEDAHDYLRAIAQWSLQRRFPVLIDDGSDEAMEDIARFVRAYKPEAILHWGPANDAPAGARIDHVHAAIAAAWDADTYENLPERWSELGFAPPGAVVASENDPAWTAALALAAGRGQQIVWVDPVRVPVGAVLNQQRLNAFDSALRAGLNDLDYPWRDEGDTIDALAICLNMPVRITQGDRGPLALTDRIGRHGDDDNAPRYAWAGQLFGDEATSAYRAMCALFLQPETFWLFNGYSGEPPFDRFNMAPAAEALQMAGKESITLDNNPNAGVDSWRRRAHKPVDAGFIAVNSAGNAGWFQLHTAAGARTRAHTSDIPMLLRPAIVSFVHSFSAQRLGNRQTIAPRWLEQGAYAYIGAVDEPFLHAFQPPATLLGRLFTPAPLGAAARLDRSPTWKIAVIGDPLITIGAPVLTEPAEQARAPVVTLDGAASFDDHLNDALQGEQYHTALRGLIMLGRDKDALELADAIRRDAPDAWTPAMARSTFFAACRQGDATECLRLFLDLDDESSHDPLIVDLMWMVQRPALKMRPSALVIDTLRTRTRSATHGEDGVLLARALRRIAGGAAADALLDELARSTDNAGQRKTLRDEMGG